MTGPRCRDQRPYSAGRGDRTLMGGPHPSARADDHEHRRRERDVETMMSAGQPRSGTPGATQATGSGRQRAVMLGLATVGLAVNFWAWALLSPLAPKFKDILHLSSFQQALLVAVPVVVGSVGRIPVGALTDRFGGRIMFPLVSLTTIVPVLYLGLAGHTTLAGLLVGGFFLGIGGTAFAVGVPFVNAWFPPERRGLAIGVFGAGMGGTAISALTTVKLVTAHGIATPFIVTAIALAAYAVLAALVLRDAPGRVVSAEPLVRRVAPPPPRAAPPPGGGPYPRPLRGLP